MATDTESRISRVEGILEQMSARLDSVEAGIADLRREFGGQIAELRNNQQSNFGWTIGTILIMWVSIIMAILLA